VHLLESLNQFFSARLSAGQSNLVLLAFSGGPDSTALLWGLAEISKIGRIRLSAAHLDHGLDHGSTARAQGAAKLCQGLDVPFHSERIAVRDHRQKGESLEACARRVRYSFLDRTAKAQDATLIATAHHRDDQIETVLLRILFGSGVAGLAGIPTHRQKIVRPLLDFAPEDLHAVLDGTGLEPIQDPSNRVTDIPRNRLRHLLLPRLIRADPSIPDRLLNIASQAHRINRLLAESIPPRLQMRQTQHGVTLSRSSLQDLPEKLRTYALAALLEAAGSDYPVPRVAQFELFRQLEANGRIGVDCGSGWRIVSQGEDLRIYLQPPFVPAFAYTLQVPGEIEIPEIGVRIGLRQGAVERWMFRGSRHRAGLALHLGPDEEVTVRNRRPGDRIRPLGCAFSRRLKNVLIDCKVPRRDRMDCPD
jgi:tRNA(Ile)-lysidine synthase